jgi:hypothetical protein
MEGRRAVTGVTGHGTPARDSRGTHERELRLRRRGDQSGTGRPRGGGPRRLARPKDALFQDLIKIGTTTFCDAYLRGSPEARAWLDGGGCEAALGPKATFERKSTEQ